MKVCNLQRTQGFGATTILATTLLAAGTAFAGEHERSTLILTSTNDPAGNAVIVFKLNDGGTPALSYLDSITTGGKGGASTNAGILQFRRDRGAVANYGSNSVTELVREDEFVRLGGTIKQAPGCGKPDSVALTNDHLFVVGANCAESHAWPGGGIEGAVVPLADPSAAQIAVGNSWSAVTLSSGSVLQLPLTSGGVLSGAATPISLPPNASSVPLGEAFWHDTLGFTPAHSPDSFAIVDKDRTVNPVTGPTPPYPTNAPCWVAKGAGNIWYTGNSPGHAISIFFSDAAGGVFYKSIPLPGAPSDVSVSHDGKWLAVIYSESNDAHVAVFSIDDYGDLTAAATSGSVGVSAFSGVAFSQ